MHTRPPNTDYWLTTLLWNDDVKKYFTNIEREIAWRTVQNAYKWTSWMEDNGYKLANGETSKCCFCLREKESIAHVLIGCNIIKEIMINLNTNINNLTTKNFTLDDNIIQFNKTPSNQTQIEWLIPLKAVNIAKNHILEWHKYFYASNSHVTNQSEWVDRRSEEMAEDLETFTENLRMHPKSTNELLSKISLRHIPRRPSYEE